MCIYHIKFTTIKKEKELALAECKPLPDTLLSTLQIHYIIFYPPSNPRRWLLLLTQHHHRLKDEASEAHKSSITCSSNSQKWWPQDSTAQLYAGDNKEDIIFYV